MDIHELSREVEKKFEEARDPEKALSMERYMKGKFPFMGIQTPARRRIATGLNKGLDALTREEMLEHVAHFWKKDEREYQYYGMDFLIKNRGLLLKEDLDFLRQLITDKSWWDTVDIIASQAVGALALSHPGLQGEELAAWSKSENIWLCRTSLLFQLKFKERTDEELLYAFIRRNAEKRDFFIEKAIGWTLREYSKTNPESVSRFIGQTKLRPLSLREGKKILELKIAKRI